MCSSGPFGCILRPLLKGSQKCPGLCLKISRCTVSGLSPPYFINFVVLLHVRQAYALSMETIVYIINITLRIFSDNKLGVYIYISF